LGEEFPQFDGALAADGIVGDALALVPPDTGNVAGQGHEELFGPGGDLEGPGAVILSNGFGVVAQELAGFELGGRYGACGVFGRDSFGGGGFDGLHHLWLLLST
jgi:hypothetical protein